MKVLVLHNNNVPFVLYDTERARIGDISFDARLLHYDSNNHTNGFDCYISDELDVIFEDYNCDLIILPFTLSEENYLEYTGLRVAAHIRLTPKWNKIATPILFVGPDTADDVTKLSRLGNIVNSYHVFITNKNNETELIDLIHDIIRRFPGGDDDAHMDSLNYKHFLESLKIKAPANYSTHHSLANEWGVQRWSEMLQIEIIDDRNDKMDFKKLLFYKYLRAKLGEPQKFNSKWWKNNPSMLSFGFLPNEKYKIVYIDDEYDKGWFCLLSQIFESQHIQFNAFKDFEDDIERKDLEKRIKNFIDSNDANCYILDLRLHESDFNENTKVLLGQEISTYIKNKNKGNQIIIFTASDKVWNLKKVLHINEEHQIKGASGYVIKESPELVYTRDQTYEIFQDFQKEILHACRQSFIKDYFNAIKDFGYTTLDSFINLLLIDKTENKKDVLSALILELMVFIEDYVLKHFEIRDGDNLYLKDSSDRIANIGRKIRFRQVGEGDDKYFEKVSCKQTVEMLDDYYNCYARSKDEKGRTYVLTIIIAVLYFYYEMPGDLINLFLYAKNERNTKIAHNGMEVSMTLDQVKSIFEKIVLPILYHD